MILRRPGVVDVLLAAAAVLCVALTMAAFLAWWLAPALVIAAASAAIEWRRAPDALTSRLPAALRISLVLAFLAVWFTRPMPLLLDHQARWLAPFLASVLASLLLLFLLSRERLAPAAGVVPAAAGLLALCGNRPNPEHFGPSHLAIFGAAGHGSFAELFVAVTLMVAGLLWTALLLAQGPQLRGRLGRLARALAASLALAAAGVLGLPALQPQVERAIGRALSRASTGLSSGATLGEFAELAQSRRRVLDLRASPPDGRWLLRAEVLPHFDGRRWSSGPIGQTWPLASLSPAPPDHPLMAGVGPWFRPRQAGRADGARLRIVQHLTETWPLLLPAHPAAITAAAPRLEEDALGLVRRPPESEARLYGAVLSRQPRAGDPPAAEALEASLALPANLDPRVIALANDLGAGATTSAEKLNRTVAHLQTRYRYTLSPGEFRPGGDPVGEFLFEKQRGYCEYFASAAVLLLRAQGVPARFVKGLSVGPHNHHGGGLFVVREADAHAWIEAWLPGEGWVEADPTPPADFAAAHVPPGDLARTVESLRAGLAELWSRLTGAEPRWTARWLLDRAREHATVILLLLLAWIGWGQRRRLRDLFRRWRARRTRPPTPGPAVPAELRQAVAEMERRWARTGRPRPRSRGLREHAIALAGSSGERQADLALVDRYYAIRFGAHPFEMRTRDPRRA